MARQTSVMGIYPDRTTVSDAIKVLHKTGYRTTDGSVLASDNQGSKDFAHEKLTRARQGAASGAAAGGVGGAALAWFASTQTSTIPERPRIAMNRLRGKPRNPLLKKPGNRRLRK